MYDDCIVKERAARGPARNQHRYYGLTLTRRGAINVIA